MIRYLLFTQVIGVVVLAFGAAFLFVYGLYFCMVLLCFGIIALVLSLYRNQQKTLRHMQHLIAHIHYGDLNLFYSTMADNKMERELTHSMNDALAAFRSRLYNSVIAEAEAEAWQKLIRVLTHEIMNSMAPVISLSETVSERANVNGMNEKDYEIMLQAMQTIHRRSKGLLGFVENYRKLTKIPSPVPHNFPLSVLFQDILLLFPLESSFITFINKPSDLSLYADRALIEQVLINLLKNAIEACEETRSPVIRIESTRQAGFIVIAIMDNGSGIASEVIDKVFVPFFTTKLNGSGIGLSLCRQIVNRHGGSISVMSKEEEGTTFILRFPVVTNRLLS